MNPRILLLFLLVLMPSLSRGQILEFSCSLQWGNSVPVPGYGQSEDSRLLFFDRAVYDETYFFLPYYTELLEWKYSSRDAEIRLVNEEYEEIKEEEEFGVSWPEDIPSSPKTEHNFLTRRKSRMLSVRIYPFRKNPSTGKKEKLISFTLEISPGSSLKSSLKSNTLKYASHSVLSSGTWYRMNIEKNGVYGISYSKLVSLGFSDPSSVRIFGQGGFMLPFENSEDKPDDLTENAVYFEKGSDGVFNSGDYLLFYAQGPDHWEFDEEEERFFHEAHLYAENSVYFLTGNTGTGKQLEDISSTSLPATKSLDYFNDYQIHELNQENLIQSGRRWFEPMVSYNSKDLEFSFPNLRTSAPVTVDALLAARSPSSSSFSILFNGSSLFSLPITYVNTGSSTSNYANDAQGSGSAYATGDDIEISLVYNNNGIASAECWVDWVSVNVSRDLFMEGNQLLFRNISSAGSGEVSEFHLSDATEEMLVWDITDPSGPQNILFDLENNVASFRLETENLREFIAFVKNAYLEPDIESEILENQDLHAGGSFDLIILTYPGFLSAAEELADYRNSHDGLRVKVVLPEQVYNEFSSGMPDVSAIRNYLKMLYDRASTEDEAPRYLLLIGDGSYDNLTQAQNNTNYLLTYQSLNSFSPTQSYVTDDFFGLLDDDEGNADGLIDIGIGRLPVGSSSEALEVVEKIIGYDDIENAGDWKNTLCFIADDEDLNIHMRDADILATFIDTNYIVFNINKIYLDAYTQTTSAGGQSYPEVNEDINEQIGKGALIINYTGHGNELGLAHESILSKSDIESWENTDRLPLFVTATCEFSRFDDVERTLDGEFTKKTSAGELVLLNSKGGGVALLTTTRLVYSSPNFVLNQNFYNFSFETDDDQSYYRLGDVLRLTKNASGTSINKRNFTLLGDPSMTLAFPKLEVLTESINSQDISTFSDTLKALEKVTISGYLQDKNGGALPDWSGVLYPTVYDKKRSVETLNNDGDGSMEFEIQNSILYKGKASIENGEFSFSFIVPKDIAYEVDYGKLSYYAANGEEEANGACRRVLIGGFSDIETEDTEGPGLELYLNDESFVSGGITDDSPELLAFVSDSSGINTTGSGIGHDITAELDEDDQNQVVLNEYYEADLDSYQSGTIQYPFSKLETGSHTLKLKVWDVYNNSSSAEIEFVVENDARLSLDHVLNYPNPFTTHTSFYFEHNQPDTEMDVLIQVFTVSGKLIKTIRTSCFTVGYRIGPIDWDGLDEFGNTIGRGVYVYRVKVRTSGGQTAEEYEKLVILR